MPSNLRKRAWRFRKKYRYLYNTQIKKEYGASEALEIGIKLNNNFKLKDLLLEKIFLLKKSA